MGAFPALPPYYGRVGQAPVFNFHYVLFCAEASGYVKLPRASAVDSERHASYKVR